MVGQIWTDPELVFNTTDILAMLLSNPLPSSPVLEMMVGSERARWTQFPDVIRVFRGHVPALEERLSWILRPEIAMDWACLGEPRTASNNAEPLSELMRSLCLPVVTTGVVQKSQIIAFIDRRKEDEVLVNPQFVRDRQSFEVFRDCQPDEHYG